jgi:FkbM family methyltransferase
MEFKLKMAGTLIKMGIPVLKYLKPDLLRRVKIMQHHGIDLLFDVGANAGQYGELTRTVNFRGKIISFEPLNDAFQKLNQASSKDQQWEINNYALGDVAGKSTINIAGNSYSSSILKMEEQHVETLPESKYIGTQEIEIKTLNDVFNSYYKAGNKVMLKIDTQGYEKQVIEGASDVLDKITLIQLEMSLVALYESELLLTEMIQFLDQKGFTLIALENGFSDKKTGQLFQVDGIFLNTKIKK